MSDPKAHNAAIEFDQWLSANQRSITILCNSKKVDRTTIEYYLQLCFYAGYKAGENKFLAHTGRPPLK